MNKLDIPSVAKWLYELEESNNEMIRKSTIGGFLIWSVIKRPLFYLLIHSEFKKLPLFDKKKNKVFPAKKILSKCYSFWRLVSFFITQLFRRKTMDVIIISKGQYKLLADGKGKYYNIISDGWFLSKDNLNKYYIEFTEEEFKQKEGVVKPDFQGEWLSAFITLTLYVFKLLDRKSHQINQFTDFLTSKVPSKDINPDFKQHLKNIIYYYQAEFLGYSILFQLLKPKVCVYVDSVGTGMMAAAIKKKIKVVELQHGLINTHRPDYIYHPALKSLKKKMIIPDTVGVFGDYFRNIFINTGFWIEKEISTIGNFQIALARSKKIDRKKTDNKFKILFPLQWHLFEETKKVITDLSKIENKDDVEIIIKIHPRQHPEQKQWVKDFIKNNKKNFLYAEENFVDLVIESDLCVGFDSTALLDSIAIGVPTITIASSIASRGLLSYFTDPKLDQSLKLVSTTEELIEAINSYKNNVVFKEEWLKEVAKTAKYVYSDNYDGNIEDIYKEYIN